MNLSVVNVVSGNAAIFIVCLSRIDDKEPLRFLHLLPPPRLYPNPLFHYYHHLHQSHRKQPISDTNEEL